jgi:hypothetical protein
LKRDKLFRQITTTEAYRAFYVDFEGFVKKAPALIGIASEYQFEQVVLTPDLEGAARAKNLRLTSLESIGEDVLRRSEAEDRLIVGYSQLERKLLWDHGGIDVGRRYRDARAIGRRWINRLHRRQVSDWSLTEMLKFIGYDPPRHMAKGLVTKRLRGVIRGLQVNGGDYAGLTPVQKAKWTKLLAYNRVDCLGMRDLTLRAASEIEASGRPMPT